MSLSNRAHPARAARGHRSLGKCDASLSQKLNHRVRCCPRPDGSVAAAQVRGHGSAQQEQRAPTHVQAKPAQHLPRAPPFARRRDSAEDESGGARPARRGNAPSTGVWGHHRHGEGARRRDGPLLPRRPLLRRVARQVDQRRSARHRSGRAGAVQLHAGIAHRVQRPQRHRLRRRPGRHRGGAPAARRAGVSTGTSLSSTCSMTSRPARPSTRASASRCLLSDNYTSPATTTTSPHPWRHDSSAGRRPSTGWRGRQLAGPW